MEPAPPSRAPGPARPAGASDPGLGGDRGGAARPVLGRAVRLRATGRVHLDGWARFAFVTDGHLILVPVKPRAWNAPPPEVIPRGGAVEASVGRSPTGEWYPEYIWYVWLALEDGRRIRMHPTGPWTVPGREHAEALLGALRAPADELEA